MNSHAPHPNTPKIVLCTFPDADTARSIATTLVEERRVACVNLIPQVESIFLWQGKLEQAQEVLAIMKTTEAGYAQLETRLADLHPYEVPEILSLNAPAGLEAYTRWVGNQVSLNG